MSPDAAAVFAQVIPILYIAVFLGEQRATRVLPRGRIGRYSILAILVIAPFSVGCLLANVGSGDIVPAWLAWMSWFSAATLAVGMMDIAVRSMGGDQARNDDERGDEPEDRV